MPITTAGLNAMAAELASLVTHVGLVDAGGTELVGGGYARQAVTWGSPSAGDVRLAGDETFSVGAGVTVGGWRGYSASSAGTDYGGENLTNETFAGAGTYVLTGSATGYNVDPA